MLKKIVLVALFVVASATGMVSAHPVTKAPVPTAPKGLCPPNMHC
jgi:hypothetical protein